MMKVLFAYIVLSIGHYSNKLSKTFKFRARILKIYVAQQFSRFYYFYTSFT
jgi:hypothetical protein